jgi:hypothetical protein
MTQSELKSFFSTLNVEVLNITNRLGETKVKINWRDYLKVRGEKLPENIKIIM